MQMIEHHKRLFAYDRWANLEVLSNLKKQAAPSARAIRLLAHIAAAEALWMDRIQALDSPVAVWPELDLVACQVLMENVQNRWKSYIDKLDEKELVRKVAYTNSKGGKFSSPVHDILTHLEFHSAYHRGQIALDVRSGGEAPAYTDFIHCARNDLFAY